jgi:peptidoglycan/LPS O-acetylase OafA/YrhL
MRSTDGRSTDRRSPGLDALRVLACAMVLLYHLRTVLHLDLGPLGAWADHGDTGVFLFFTLSGYLLYKPFVRGVVDLRIYAIRRAARILPGYWLALIGLAVFTRSQLPIQHPLAYATITASYDVSNFGFMHIAWTLAAEIGFYIVLPLLAVLARGREIAVLIAAALASVAFGTFVLLNLAPGNEWLLFSLPVVFYQFVPGMILAVVEVRQPRAFARLAGPVPLLAGVAILTWSLTPSPTGLELRSGVGAAILMGWLIQHRVPFARPLSFLGGMSYAVYLWHVDVLATFGLIGLVLVLAAATASWVFLERPVLRWAERFTNGLRERAPERPTERHTDQPATDPVRPISIVN